MSPVSSAIGMKVEGGILAFGRMPPAHQRLVAGEPAAAEIELRLIVEIKLVLAQRVAEIVLQPAPFLQGRVHGRLEEAESVAAVLLGAIEREVGVLEQRVGGLTVERADGDADAGRGRHLVAVDMIGLAERGADASRKPHGVFRRSEVLGDDGELVAAKTADQVDVAHALLEPCRDLLEQCIAGGMAERIVHVLEAVEIEPEHGHQLTMPLGPRHGAVEMLAELKPVGQPGQRIVHGEIADLVLGEPALADAPRGDCRWHGEAEHDEEARHQRRHRERDIGERRRGRLVEREGIDARDLAVLQHGNERGACVAGFVGRGNLDGVVLGGRGERVADRVLLASMALNFSGERLPAMASGF